MAVAEIVEYRDFKAALIQQLDHVRADIPGSADDQYAHEQLS
jgi:hypothetical protein